MSHPIKMSKVNVTQVRSEVVSWNRALVYRMGGYEVQTDVI
jgi:hypothetical protein